MLMGAVRDTNMLSQWRTVFQAARHIPLESGDARAGCAPQAPLGPTSPWEAPGVRVGAAVGLRGVLEAGAVSVVSLVVLNLWTRRLRTDAAAGWGSWLWLLEAGSPARRGPRKGATCPIWHRRSPLCGAPCGGGGREMGLGPGRGLGV